MHISSIRLENIKSYVDSEINLTPGTNAICGPNGSGKTTLVEAIGCALFGHLPYKQASFVREGEQTGTVRVRIIALDGRTYDIVRHVGQTALHYVFDVELKRKITDKTTAVEEWVRSNVLNGDGSEDPEFLFLNAVGVPQGLMTAIFMLAPAQRKPTFDRLLGVEDYAKASEKLRDTERFLSVRIGEVREEIGRRETETAQIPQYEIGIADYRSRICRSRECLQAVQQELLDTENQLRMYDELEERGRFLTDALRMRAQEQVMLEAQLQSARERRERSAAALNALESARPGHDAYALAEAEFQDLEPAIAERDRLRCVEHEALAILENRSFEVRALSDQLTVAREGETKAAQLAAPIADLDRLESLLTEAEQANVRVQDFDAQLAALGAQRDQAQMELSEVQRSIATLDTSASRIPDLTALESRRQELRDRYQVAVEAAKRIEAAEKEVAGLEASLDSLKLSIASKRDVVKGIETLRAMVKRLPELVAQQQKTGAEDQQLQVRIQLQELARGELFKNQCPLLPVRCPAVEDKAWVNESLTQNMTALRTQKALVSERHETARVALLEAEKARDQVSELTIAEKELELLESQLGDQQARLDDQKANARQLQVVAQEAELLKEQGLKLAEEIEAGLQLEREIAGLPARREYAESLSRRIATVTSQEADINVQKQPLIALAQSIPDLRKKSEPLRPLRGELDRALIAAAQKPALEGSLAHARHEKDRAQETLNDIRAKLELFSDVDVTAERLKEILQTNRVDRDTFLRNEEEAAALPSRIDELETLTLKLAEVEKAIAESMVENDSLAQTYSAEDHAGFRAKRDDLIGRRSSLQTEIQGAMDLIALADEKIAELRESMIRLESARSRRAGLEQTSGNIEFFRQVLKVAGPAITESLVQGVSDVAGQIFGDIMDDHALDLRWERDYEIVVRRGTEDRPFVQLSGGEQMSAALAVRLALVKQISDISIAFFDEPTQNMDGLRRSNLAEQIEKVRGFEQILVISHDDSFEHHTDSVIRLKKERDRTVVESA